MSCIIEVVSTRPTRPRPKPGKNVYPWQYIINLIEIHCLQQRGRMVDSVTLGANPDLVCPAGEARIVVLVRQKLLVTNISSSRLPQSHLSLLISASCFTAPCNIFCISAVSEEASVFQVPAQFFSSFEKFFSHRAHPTFITCSQTFNYFLVSITSRCRQSNLSSSI